MKPRSDAKLLNLPEEQQAQLADWLLSGMPYHVARATVEKEFGVKVALSAFTQFWSEVCAGAYIQRRARAVGLADEVAEQVTRTPGQFDKATVDALRQKAFELSVSPQTDPKDVKAIFTLLLKSRDQDIAERRVALLEQKAAQADRVKEVVEGPQTPEQKQAAIRQIFGM